MYLNTKTGTSTIISYIFNFATSLRLVNNGIFFIAIHKSGKFNLSKFKYFTIGLFPQLLSHIKVNLISNGASLSFVHYGSL